VGDSEGADVFVDERFAVEVRRCGVFSVGDYQVELVFVSYNME
jgi:hypothetical protein